MSEPVYRAPARWIDRAAQETAALSGATVVAPIEVLATHLLEVLKSNLGRLLTYRSLNRVLDELGSLSDATRADANKRLLSELIPDKVPLDLLLGVLRLLLDERVSIRNLPLILEALAELRGAGQSPETLCEHVRQRLGFSACLKTETTRWHRAAGAACPGMGRPVRHLPAIGRPRQLRYRLAARRLRTPDQWHRGKAVGPWRKRHQSGRCHLVTPPPVPAHGTGCEGSQRAGAQLRGNRVRGAPRIGRDRRGMSSELIAALSDLGASFGPTIQAALGGFSPALGAMN